MSIATIYLVTMLFDVPPFMKDVGFAWRSLNCNLVAYTELIILISHIYHPASRYPSGKDQREGEGNRLAPIEKVLPLGLGQLLAWML